jgi:hypothetical protein
LGKKFFLFKYPRRKIETLLFTFFFVLEISSYNIAIDDLFFVHQRSKIPNNLEGGGGS